jgi:hypothetical protein
VGREEVIFIDTDYRMFRMTHMKTYVVKVNDIGTKEWYLNNKRHREDGPAVEHSNGTKEWYLNGQLHRTDGPAVEYSNGTKEWYLNGQLHRTDGPAVEYSYGTKLWYLNGIEFTETEFQNKINKKKKKKNTASCVGKVIEIDGKKYKLVEV